MNYKYKHIDLVELTKEEEKIKKLLSLAFKNKNEHEQEVALIMAEKLAKKHNINIEEIEVEKQEKDVYYYNCYLDITKISSKFTTISSYLRQLEEIFPVDCLVNLKDKAYAVYSNFRESLIVMKEFYTYIKYIYSYKTTDFICSFISGFVDGHRGLRDIGQLIVLNDIGAKLSIIETKNKKIYFDPKGFADGKKFVEGDKGKLNEQNN